MIDAYFSATKIRFILDAVPGAQARAERGELAFGTVDSWLLYRLTRGRVHATEPSNASRTMLYDIHAREWSERLLAELRIPRALLPEVRDSSGAFGEAHPELARRRRPDRRHGGRPAGRPVRAGLLHAGQRQEHLRHRAASC